MKVLDMRGMQVIYQGSDWPFDGKDPCTRDMLPFLERNESIISWVQPVGCSGLSGQIPAIRVRGCYCGLSLRMMKSVWRHVRLKKEFVNVETLPHGGDILERCLVYIYVIVVFSGSASIVSFVTPLCIHQV